MGVFPKIHLNSGPPARGEEHNDVLQGESARSQPTDTSIPILVFSPIRLPTELLQVFIPTIILMMRHPQGKKVGANSQLVTTILRCVPAMREQKKKNAGPASGPLGSLTKPTGSPSSGPRHREWSVAGRRASASRVKRKAMFGLSMLPVLVRSGLSQVACFCRKKKKSSACLPYFFASLNSVAVTRALMTSKALRNGHSNSHMRPYISISFKHLGGKILLFEPVCDIDDLCSLRSSAFAVGRHFVTLPVLGLQVPTSCSGDESELISQLNMK